MSAHVQHRLRSLGGDQPQRDGRDQHRVNLTPTLQAVLPQRHIRLLRNSSANNLAGSTVAARLKSTEPCTAISDAHHGPRVPAGVKRIGHSARTGLAVWQQLVLEAYIEKQIAESISVRALARFICLSSDSFRRAFKQSFGMPPRRYLVHRRIERAKTLLACSEWSVANIGRALNFGRTSSFSAAFRQLTGVTPSEFRQAPAVFEKSRLMEARLNLISNGTARHFDEIRRFQCRKPRSP